MAFTRRNIKRPVTAAVRTMFRIVTFLCLCASMWQAPLPCVHLHSDGPDSSLSQMMDRHLSMWHCTNETDESGWHLHFAMLDDILRGGGCPVPQGSGEDELPLTIEHVVSANQIVSLSDALLAPAQSFVLSQDESSKTSGVSTASRTRRQFLGDQAEERQLLTMLCIIRC
ncbi:MAG: hypothetical protein ACI8P0_001631 [Planctomycetaceae bacterium]|jgi:hypothetical protein